MPKAIKPLLFLFLISVTSSYAHFQPCQQWLQQERLRLIELRSIGAETATTRDSDQTVRVAPIQGGRVAWPASGTLLQRTASSWQSTYAFKTHAPQSDPRRFLFITGDRLGLFFGFQLIGDDFLRAPDAAVLNSRIAALNLFLPADRKIQLQFSEEDSEDPEHMVAQFGEQGLLPFGSKTEDLIAHDLAYHSAAMFIPPEEMSRGQFLNRHFIGFKNYLRQKRPDLWANPLVKDHFDIMTTRRWSTIDLATGNFQVYYEYWINRFDKQHLSSAEKTLRTSTHEPLTHFDHSLEDFLMEIIDANNWTSFYKDDPKILHLPANLSDKLKKTVQDYLNELQFKNEQDFALTQISRATKDFASRTIDRTMEIERAAREACASLADPRLKGLISAEDCALFD